jgi:hypothetical protein
MIQLIKSIMDKTVCCINRQRKSFGKVTFYEKHRTIIVTEGNFLDLI